MLNKDRDIFSEEYAIKEVTGVSRESFEDTSGEQTEDEETLYGTAKPFRIIIRARMARDES